MTDWTRAGDVLHMRVPSDPALLGHTVRQCLEVLGDRVADQGPCVAVVLRELLRGVIAEDGAVPQAQLSIEDGGDGDVRITVLGGSGSGGFHLDSRGHALLESLCSRIDLGSGGSSVRVTISMGTLGPVDSSEDGRKEG